MMSARARGSLGTYGLNVPGFLTERNWDLGL
jgi:hypothetical protein